MLWTHWARTRQSSRVNDRKLRRGYLLGLFAVYRMTAVNIAFAERRECTVDHRLTERHLTGTDLLSESGIDVL